MLIKRRAISRWMCLLSSLGILSTFGVPASGDPAPDAASVLHARMTTASAAVEAKLADPAASVDSRDLASAALTTLMHGGDAAGAQRDIDRAFAKQDLNPNSPTFGQVPWRTADTHITDLNAAPFLGQGLATVLNGYKNRFPAAYLASLRPHLSALSQAIERQNVAVTYTNIYLTRAVDLILLGQYLNDGPVLAEGRASLRSWVDKTRATGISEFDTTWYYPVDLTALSQCYRYASDASDRGVCGTSLRYFWTDIADNFLPSAHKLAGPSSREYDFVSGNGDLAYWFEAVGWDTAAQIGHANLYSAQLEDLLRNGGYRPSEDLRALAFSGPRDITSTYDAYPGHTRWNWIGRNVSLGCAGGSYGGQDKLLVATFGGPAKAAQLNVLVLKNGNPYGATTGDVKPTHIAPTLGCIERGGAAIATFFVEPAGVGATPRGLETDVLFPKDATVAVDGATVSLANGDVPMRPGSILAVRTGGGVVALKALRIESLAGAATLKLTTDVAGSARGAAWLSITHLQPGETALPGRLLRESFLVVARDDGSIEAATAELRNAGGQDTLGPAQWNVGATFPQGRFELERSSVRRGVISEGTIDGRLPPRFPLGLNGQDQAASIWQALP